MSNSDRTDEIVIEADEAAEVIMATAACCGVEYLWFHSGSDLTSFQEAATKARHTGVPSPAIATALHEHVGLCHAMGQTMLTGQPAMIAAHADLGLLNMGGAIHNALVGRYPVLLLTGYPPTTAELRNQAVYWMQQRWDAGSIVRQFVKWDYRLSGHENEDVSIAVARALQVALTPPQGLAYLLVPPEAARRRVHGPAKITTATQLGIGLLGSVDSGEVSDLAARILAADHPLIITERLGHDFDAVETLASIAREFAIAVSANKHRMSLADGHAAGHADYGLVEADVVLVLDHLVPWIPSVESPRHDAWVVVVGPDAVASHVPIYEFAASRRFIADPGRFLRDLQAELLRQRTNADRERQRQRWSSFEASAHRRAKAIPVDSAGDSLTPANVGRVVAAILAVDDLVTWELTEETMDHIPRTKPGTLFDKGASSLGWAVAAATGARMLDRGRPAVCLTGDGSYIFGVPTALLWSQQQHDAPVLTVVCNNRSYRTGTEALVRHYPDGYSVAAGDLTGGVFDPPPDVARHADAAGGFGARVTTVGELRDALCDARVAVEQHRRPAVIDAWLPALVTGQR